MLIFGSVVGLSQGKAEEAAAEWARYIDQHSILLGSEDEPIARGILEALAEKELVLLGETTHGTLEYYTWRATITKALIRDAGFRYIAVEADWTALDPLDRYVRHLPGSVETALEALQEIDRWAEWMWANPVILDLAEWLRAWNESLPPEKRVGFHGIDVYGWGDSVSQLPAELERLEAGWGGRAESELKTLRAFKGDTQSYARALARGQATGSAVLEAILERLAADSEQWRMHNPDAFLRAQQHCSVVIGALCHLRKSVFGHPRSWNPRAANFMSTVLRLRDYHGDDARGLVWAHNTHIGDARFTGMGQGGLFTVGQQAREILGEEAVFLLGFSTDRGTFRAGEHWGGPGHVIDLLPATPGSIDHLMAESTGHDLFLPLQHARSLESLNRPIGHRAIGIVHANGSDSSRNYVPSIVPMRYDGLLFLRETSALPEL